MGAPKKNKAKRKPGRPRKVDSVKELQKKIDAYFYDCDNRMSQVYDKKSGSILEFKNPIPYTIEGLCEALEMDRDTLLNYGKKEGYEDYFGTIKRAKLKVQRNKLERGLEGLSNPTLTIFDLKNNHGYRDESQVDHTNDGGKFEPPKIEFK
jgi:hypothetical protein